MLHRLPIKIKLFLLAGVPVVGALVLSYLVASDAQRRLESAESLGSIEDLAKLAETISLVVDDLQDERMATAYALGRAEAAGTELSTRRKKVDASVAKLEDFFTTRNTEALPARLSDGIHSATERLKSRGVLRRAVDAREAKLEELSETTHAAISDLIGATAALTTLSDDGVMLRNISGLVSVMELKERASQEQALLAYVFSQSEFPPGGYKSLVNLVTEQEVFDRVLRRSTSSDLVHLYEERLNGKKIDRALALRNIALETMDDNFGVDPTEWVDVQGQKVSLLRGLSHRLNERVRLAARARLDDANDAVAASRAITVAVILVSILLALIISLGISRSVHALVDAAQHVQNEQDFSVRAEKKTEDELGRLTDAFNHMLDGIQKRDEELEHHRATLEQTVAERTSELAARNEAMRVVLDNVDQGLATINVDGTLQDERSAAFDAWFNMRSTQRRSRFYDVLAANDNALRDMMELGWEGLTDGFLPIDMAADQIPRRLSRDGRHFELTYKPMGGPEDFHGALLMVTDITAELLRKQEEAEQRELLFVFEAVMRDRSGFIEFVNDTEDLVEKVTQGRVRDEDELARTIHTIKGNAGIYSIQSVAQTCHDLEQACLDEQRPPKSEELARLSDVWDAFSKRVRMFASDADDDVIEVRYDELESIVQAIRARTPHAALEDQLLRLKHEPTDVRFHRIADQATRLASKLGKEVRLEIQPNHVRLPRDRWANFWNVFVHVVRNAVDHGIEPQAERVQSKKSRAGLIRLESRQDGEDFVIEMKDDGRGIDWEKVRQKAKDRGLAHQSQQDLVDALFADGLSTRDEATDLSGRGVGMAVVKAATTALGGRVTVSSVAHQGTELRFRIPIAGNDVPLPQSRRPGVRASLAPPGQKPATSRKVGS